MSVPVASCILKEPPASRSIVCETLTVKVENCSPGIVSAQVVLTLTKKEGMSII